VTITVLFFAQARDAAGRARDTIELPEGSLVVDALALLERAHPRLALLRSHLAVAIDERLARPDAPLRHGAEMALLPPVSGG
jgi:molybdopterin synthase catalytic subunit